MGRISSDLFRAEGSILLGDVTVGEECGFWYHAVIRGDTAPVVIGARTNVQDNAVIHVDPGYPVELGEDVTVGHGAILHGCTVGDNTVIGMGAIVMNGARIGKDCIIAAGALVPQGAEIPDRSLAVGSPCKVRRETTEEEIEANRLNAEMYVKHAKEEAEKT